MITCDFSPAYSDLGIYFRTVDRKISGEVEETQQLADAAGGNIVDRVPNRGLLLYQIQSIIGREQLRKDIDLLRERKGKTAWICGALACSDDVEQRKMFLALKEISGTFFARSRAQQRLLAGYGIKTHYLPNNERSCVGLATGKEKSVIYSGFLWPEKRTDIFLAVASMMPEWNFTLHAGMNTPLGINYQPHNVTVINKFLSRDEHMELLSSHRYVWLPRSESPWIYPARSSLTAIASGSIAVLPRVGPNEDIPENVAIKYCVDCKPETIADILFSPGREINEDARREYLKSVSPETAWKTIQSHLT